MQKIDLMDDGSSRTSDARLAAEALLSQSGTLTTSSLNAINYGFVACILRISTKP